MLLYCVNVAIFFGTMEILTGVPQRRRSINKDSSE